MLQASEREEGLVSERLGCYAEARGALDIRGVGALYANLGLPYGHTAWSFDGQEIFKRAVTAMALAGQEALARRGILLPAFGAGLSWCAHRVRWGERTAPLGVAEIDLPPCDRTALEVVRDLRARKARHAEAVRSSVEAVRPLLRG